MTFPLSPGEPAGSAPPPAPPAPAEQPQPAAPSPAVRGMRPPAPLRIPRSARGRSRPHGSSPFPRRGPGLPPPPCGGAGGEPRKCTCCSHFLLFVRAARSIPRRGASHPAERQVSGAGVGAGAARPHPPPSSPPRGCARRRRARCPPGRSERVQGGWRGAAAGQVLPLRGREKAGGPAGPGCAGMYPTMLRATCSIQPLRSHCKAPGGGRGK